MRRAALSVALFALAGLVLATGASAVVYTVTLANGTTIDSRYQPQYASWDPAKVVLLTEYGNQISLATSEIQNIAVDTETRGFGHQIDTTTMALGWAPNDALDPDSDEGRAALAADQEAAARGALAPPVYNQQQFVEPSQTSGLPVWMTGVNAVPQLEPAQAVSSPPNR